MKLSEYIAKNGDKEVSQEELNKLLGIKESKVWKPKYDDWYYVIDFYNLEVCKEKWEDENIEKVWYKIGGIYKTEEEAIFARDKKLFEVKMERYLRENEDEEVDWNNVEQVKYSLYFENNSIEIAYWKSCYFQGSILTTSKMALNYFIKDNEQDIKKYLFGVK